MSKYKIWDKVSDVMTPSMKIFTPDQWMEKYPVAKLENIKVVMSGGEINGAYFGLLNVMVERAKNAGCDFSDCKTDQDYLDRIEEWESKPAEPVEYVSTEDRIAASLEALVLLNLPEEE